jgi:hypothetical protein
VATNALADTPHQYEGVGEAYVLLTLYTLSDDAANTALLVLLVLLVVLLTFGGGRRDTATSKTCVKLVVCRQRGVNSCTAQSTRETSLRALFLHEIFLLGKGNLFFIVRSQKYTENVQFSMIWVC